VKLSQLASNWSGAGANGSADTQPAMLGNIYATSSGVYRINFSDAGVAAVQQWINDASRNYGIIIKDYTNSRALEIRTSETSTASQRPKLVINFTPPQLIANLTFSGNLPPVVNAGPNLTAVRNQPISISAAVNDDGQPGGSALLTMLWSKVSGPGTVTFGNDLAVSTTAAFSAAGNYVLKLSVSDGVLTGFDELSVTVS
jgi:K319L-like, PKD domain